LSYQLSGKQIIFFVMLSAYLIFGSLVMSVVEGSENEEMIIQATSPIEIIVYPAKIIEPTATATTPLPVVLPPATTPVCDYPNTWHAYSVEFGDTLNNIADSLLVAAEKIIEGNCIEIPFLDEGDVIYLPVKSTLAPPIEHTQIITSFATEIPQIEEVSCGAPTDWKTYAVKKGDTLFSISNAFGVEIPQIQFANCMGESTSVITGIVLNVPNVSPNVPTASP
jgi:LysM repeat protein